MTLKYPPIGIAGAARSGKDTLCQLLIYLFQKHNIESYRQSMAGDIIRKDLEESFIKKIQPYSFFTEDLKEKEILRPIMVEYGRLLRKTTEGRYFIEKAQNIILENNSKIAIIPDIRYAEYKKDELFWIKNEIKGYLIFIKKESNNDANVFEQMNNKILEKNADFVLEWPVLGDLKENLEEYEQYASKIVDIYTKNHHLPIGHLSALK
jgi:hypothetical protein